MPNIEVTQLKYMQAIVKAGSLSGAARALKVSQPTLTAAVQKLEKNYGTTLLNRNPKGVELTVTGQALIEAAARIFSILDEVDDVIGDLEGEDRGRFSIGCHESLGAYFLPGFIKRFLVQSPDIDVSIFNASSERVRQAVIDREIPFALVVNVPLHPDLVVVDLFGDAVTALVLKENQAATLEQAHEMLGKGPVVYAGRVTQAQQILQDLARAGITPKRRLDCGDLELVKSLVLEGIGPGLLPERVANYGHAKTLVPIHPDFPRIKDRISLVWRGDLHRTQAARRLKDALVEYGRELEAARLARLNVAAPTERGQSETL